MIPKNIKGIPYGTKCFRNQWGNEINVPCFITGYNPNDDTYNIANGWDVTHVLREDITLHT